MVCGSDQDDQRSRRSSSCAPSRLEDKPPSPRRSARPAGGMNGVGETNAIAPPGESSGQCSAAAGGPPVGPAARGTVPGRLHRGRTARGRRACRRRAPRAAAVPPTSSDGRERARRRLPGRRSYLPSERRASAQGLFTISCASKQPAHNDRRTGSPTVTLSGCGTLAQVEQDGRGDRRSYPRRPRARREAAANCAEPAKVVADMTIAASRSTPAVCERTAKEPPKTAAAALDRTHDAVRPFSVGSPLSGRRPSPR